MATKNKEQILTKDLRETLKSLMQKEIEALPGLLETLEPKDRLNVLCKLMPFVFPKTATVPMSVNEPDNDPWGFNS